MLDVKELEAKAGRLAALAREREAAFAKERAAEVALVDGVVRTITHALPALCGRIVSSNGEDPQAGASYVNHLRKDPSKRESDHFRGVLVYEEKDWDFDTERHSTTSRRFYLLDKPELNDDFDMLHWLVQHFEVTDYDDSSRTPLFRCVGTVELLDMLGRKFTAEQVVDKISSLIDAQLGGDMPKRTKEANARAEKLHALATLMAPPSTPSSRRKKDEVPF